MKHKISFSLVAVAALGLWSCSDVAGDMPETPNPEVTSGETAYIGFRLKDAEESRTRDTHKEYDDDYERFEWFNKGSANERAIIDNPDANRVLFFNSDYSFFGAGKLQKPDVANVASNIYVAPMSMAEETVPAYVMIVINGDPVRLDELQTDLEAAGTNAVKTALTYVNNVDTDSPETLAMFDGYFTMSSVVYRPEDTDRLFDLNPLDTSGPVFFETIEEAILPENLTTFYVERLLAKFTLIIKDGNLKFSDNKAIVIPGTNRLNVRLEYAPADALAQKDVMTGWKVNIVNWGLNGLEKNTYLVKNLVESPATYPFSVSGNFYTGWNSPVLMRSFWGIDENYSTGVYPDQYRQSLNVEGVKAATTNNIYSDNYNAANGLAKGDYTLIYKPYNAYTDRTENKYSLENTFDSSILSGQDLNTSPWLRCGTHILMTAQLIFDEIDTDLDLTQVDANGFIKGVSDKYFSNGLWWSEKALKEQALATLLTNIYYNKKGGEIPNVLDGGYVDYINYPGSADGTVREKILDTNVPVLVVVDGQDVPLRYEDLAKNAEEFFEFAPAFIQGGDGWVSLKKKDGVVLKANYINAPAEVITDAQLVSYIYRFTNLAKHYNEGRMYYALALRHNLDSENFLTDPVTKVSTGDYGVVRNTWYRLTLNSVLKPGIPVDDPDQPIIPNPEPDDKSLGVEVEIIPWRTVDINVGQLH